MEDQDRDHISSRSHFSGRSEQELDEMLDELRAGKIGINQPGQNSSEHDSEDTPEENDNASGTGNAAKSKKGKSRKEGFNLKDEVISWIQESFAYALEQSNLCKKIKQQIGETVSFTFYLLYAIVSLYFAFRCITNPFGNSGAIPCRNTQCLIVFYKYQKDFQEYCIHAGEYI